MLVAFGFFLFFLAGYFNAKLILSDLIPGNLSSPMSVWSSVAKAPYINEK